VIDLIIIVIFSAVLVPLVEFSSGALRIALGLVFVLFSPGYTLIAALFPRKSDIGGIERVALSFGLSIAVVPLIGLALRTIRPGASAFIRFSFPYWLSLSSWRWLHGTAGEDFLLRSISVSGFDPGSTL